MRVNKKNDIDSGNNQKKKSNSVKKKIKLLYKHLKQKTN